MRFRVELARKAAREIAEHHDWLAGRSPAGANRWRQALLAAIESLEDNPQRCPAAPEAEWHPGLRQLVHGDRRRAHRILFEVRGNLVVILRVRHGAQDSLGPEEL